MGTRWAGCCSLAVTTGSGEGVGRVSESGDSPSDSTTDAAGGISCGGACSGTSADVEFVPAAGRLKSIVYVFIEPGAACAWGVDCTERSGPDSISGIRMTAAATRTAAPMSRSFT